ncbi:uncharacterized protein MELLADRAFT_36361 [Melampsora larici-populina 98AG31]|uniref:tRNA (guanine(10)-N(2))-methyltransferase TRMT11 N-terminal domain-containing protein n=1 Tax=Melampsora larici-populina (strain 98AG31 / pathotype 3-4-7) TaxID=747676 RepID=F4RNF4_MELLP|nr:uncharacterized protein MELLADRAFT_36361 [Melampsora larici-populina 98AG31]EGG05978.1 hypothetical protein MELLADRAFT_36361 [Melampsora larici-populina 98AG31]
MTIAHEEFRMPELDSLNQLLDLGLEYEESEPYMVVTMTNDQKARDLGSRAILVKHVLKHWADAASYDDLHNMNKANHSFWDGYVESASFKITVTSFKSTLTQARKSEIIESLSYMDFKGPIQLNQPDVEIMISEEHHNRLGRMTNIQLRRVWLGEKLCDGQRSLVDRFDLKKRAYIGNTSMEAGLSLLMANQGLVRDSSFVTDPFTGTGSMLYAAAWFGAFVFGSDIDGRPIRGKGLQVDISFDLTIFFCVFLLLSGLFVSIERCAKRLGRKDNSKLRDEPYMLPDGTWSHELSSFHFSSPIDHTQSFFVVGEIDDRKSDYIPPSRPWEMSEVLEGLLEFSLRMLKPNGRLVYWLPTVTEDYKACDVPQIHGMELVANSCQDFGKWQRRVSELINFRI